MVRRDFLRAASALALPLALPACYVRAVPASAPIVYEPLLYDGYVVYYEGDGIPVYYVDGIMYYVPTSHPRYHVYVRHYRRHRDQYRRWHRAHPVRRRNEPRREPRPPTRRRR